MAITGVNLGAYKTRFNGRYGQFKKAVILKLFSAVIYDTPVDTGRLRGNWKLSMDEGNYPSAQPDLFDKVGGVTVAEVAAGIQQNVTPADQVVNLSNSLPYVNRIEYEGWSRLKAPDGMVRRNVVRIASNLQEEVNNAAEST